jgi:A/G-specific adenine glycosylase
MNLAHPVLDGNVKRVLCRYYGINGWPGKASVANQLWQLARQLLVTDRPAAYTQAMMDLGATVCVRSNPLCGDCPVSNDCVANRQGLQHDLPHRKAGKALPVKQLQFIMIQGANGEIMLQKRPPMGIWGGLWGFPECPAGQDAVAWVREHFGYRVNSVAYEPEMKHTFTHFQLQITPVRMQLKSAPAGVHDHDDLYWFKPGGDNKTLGMAAPVKKLVENLN